jgi:N-acetylmuramoyl-L-alanine amidase
LRKLQPAHGGSDPGKIGLNNLLEKDINLAIAKKLKVCLEKAGFEVVMTREADESVKGPEQGNKKSTDMRNRCAKIRETKPAMAVSIHQNSYTTPEVKGAQVFYYTNSAEGKKLAEGLQTALVEGVDPENHREAKGNTSYYLLKKTDVPLAIVECGFLSNPEEAGLLATKEYQEKVAEAVCTGILKYLEKSD